MRTHSNYPPPYSRRVHPLLRPLHSLRSCLVPISLSLLFGFLLASLLLLSEPRKPARKLGWQSWDVIELPAVKGKTGGLAAEVGGGNETASGNGTSIDEGVENDEEGWKDVSLPLDVWDPLLPHRTGLTAITISACILPPSYFQEYCAPPTTPDEDARLGKWVRVEKDLIYKTGIWFLNVYYRRSRRLDVAYITDIQLFTSKIDLPDLYTLASGDDLHSGVYPTLSPLWLAYKTQSSQSLDEMDDWSVGGEAGDKGIITEIDVLFGDGEPWFGFSRISPNVLDSGKKHPEPVSLVVRKGTPALPSTPELLFSSNGTFRVMQVADLHYSVGNGECRDTDKDPCVGDRDSATLFAEVLDVERPDFVVFSGDQLNGQSSSWDSMSVLAKFAQPVIARKIPWALVFGNHDDEDDLTRTQLMNAISKMPYSLASAGPSDVDGTGNYLLKVRSGDPSRIHLLSLYFLDSGAYAKKKTPWGTKDYDWIKESQIQWYLRTSNSVSPIERPFHPDTASDLEDIWARRDEEGEMSLTERQGEVKTMRKPNALMFFHIPLIEHALSADIDPSTGDAFNTGITNEGSGSPKHNSGFFTNGLLQATTGQLGSDGKELHEVKVVANGHVHTDENCKRIEGVWMCFGGGGSYSGYGKLGFERRFRIYDISEFGQRISTYKHTESGTIIDRQDLFGGGAPAI